MGEIKIGRGLDDEIIDILKKSGIVEFYNKNKNELFLAIRNNYINIYYKGASICKANFSKKNGLTFDIHKKYIEKNIEQDYFSTKNFEDIAGKYTKIKAIIDTSYSETTGKREKTAQQELIINNNRNKAADWFCIDMEYIRQRASSQENLFGRFDIIAISKNAPHTVALIELKVGNSAIGGKSGIAKHLCDYDNYIGKEMTNDELIPQITEIIKSYIALGIELPFSKEVNKTQFNIIPQPYFIILEKNKNTLGSIKKYIFDKKGSSKYNYEKVYKNEYKNLKVKPIFLATEKKSEIIDNLLNKDLYENIESFI